MATMHKVTWGAVVMGLVLVGALVGMAPTDASVSANGCGRRRENLHTMLKDDGKCNETNPCPTNLCCSSEGYCGCTDAYCGNGCVSQCDGCQCKENKDCAPGFCCGESGICGYGEDYCPTSSMRSNSRHENLHTMLKDDGKCNETNPCPTNLCCSSEGYCGCTDAYCGNGCVGQCDGCKCKENKDCAPGFCCGESGICGYGEDYCPTSSMRSNSRHENLHTMLKDDGKCNETNPCPTNLCCSSEGYCGCTDAYCGNGCVGQCDGCKCKENKDCAPGFCCGESGICGYGEDYCPTSSDRSNSGHENLHTMLKDDGKCNETNPCPTNLCCSSEGYCGCTDAYCGNGCVGQCDGCKCKENKDCAPGFCCGESGICGYGEDYCPTSSMGSNSGQATYYTTYVPSSCYGFDTSKFPKGNLIAAASRDVFGNNGACGTYYQITCKGAANGGRNPCKKNPTVKVMVVDLCPGCNKNSFDLSKEAFSKIAHLDAGRINIEVKRVSYIAEVV